MTHSSARDVVVIGAGAAGLGAAAHLKAAGLDVLVLEAKDRVGGRAHTVRGPEGSALDLGCGWLHSADQNPWAKMVAPMGFTLDQSAAAWARPAMTINFPIEAQQAYRQAISTFEAALEQAAEQAGDMAAAELFHTVEPRWRPMLDAFSGYYNGAPFQRISVKDYAAYQPTDENWRVREGYGALIDAFAAGVEVSVSMPVQRIEHGGPALRACGGWGAVEARAIVVAVSSTVLAEGVIGFDPPLPDKRRAASNLPLGHVEKAFLRLARPQAWPIETMVRGRTDTALTGGYTFRPMGMPVVEGFFGGDLAASLEMAEAGAFCAFAIDELAAVMGSDFRDAVEPIVQSTWRGDPFIQGAYSHARVGCSGDRATLAEPVADRLFFAGEAVSPHAFSTAHGAYETGLAAARAIVASLKGR